MQTITVWPTVSKLIAVPHTREEYEQLVTFYESDIVRKTTLFFRQEKRN